MLSAQGGSRTRTGRSPRDFKLNRPAGLAAHTGTRAPRQNPVNPTITTTSPHTQRATLTCMCACCASSYDWLGHKRGTATRGVLTPLAPGRAGPDTDQITQRDDCEPGFTGESYPRRKDSVECRPLLKRGDSGNRVEPGHGMRVRIATASAARGVCVTPIAKRPLRRHDRVTTGSPGSVSETRSHRATTRSARLKGTGSGSA